MKTKTTAGGCRHPMRYYYQSGQSTISYAIATSILVLSLFVPWGGNQAAVVQFLEGARKLHQNVTYVLSLP